MIGKVNEFQHKQAISQFILEKYGDERISFTAGFELTANCNYRCIHCYASPNREKEKLSNYQIKRILDTLVEHGTIEIFFTGGECLTRSDFKDIYIYAKKKGLLVTILTNASLITEEMAHLFLEYPVEEISLTMYGYTKETYEVITRSEGSFEKFHQALDIIKKYQLPCQFKVIGMKQNIHECYEMIQYGHSLGFPVTYSFDIRPMVNLDSSPLELRVTPEEAFWFDQNDPERYAFWKEVAKNIHRPKDEIDQRIEDNYLYPCMMGKNFVFINCEGKMQGCVKHSLEQYDLLHGNFEEGWAYLGEIRDRKASPQFVCNHCDASDYCEQCTVNHQLEHGEAEKPVDFYCHVGHLRKEMIDQMRMEMNLE